MSAGARDPASAVFASPVTRTVFLQIAAGEGDLGTIVRKGRLLRPAAEGALKDFAARGLVVEKDGRWELTPTGAALREDIRKHYL